MLPGMKNFRAPGLRVFAVGVALAAQAPALTLEELAEQPKLWPAEVRLTGATKATRLKDGAPTGVVLLGSGNIMAVQKISANGVTGRVGADLVLVPAEKTDLVSRVGMPATEAVQASATDNPAPALAAAKQAPPAAPAIPEPVRPSRMQRQLAGKLVRLEGDDLQPVDAGRLAGVKYYGLYYSASWCGPCRQFTPQFVKIYRQMKQRYPEFEVVFVSADRSGRAMRDYMRDDRMPWLALKYEEAQRDGELRRYCGPGIPCLVLVAADGRVLSDSFEGDNYVGPGKVLDDAARLLAKVR
jgi:nucleoredoxin